jgi:1-acyl-sn-glycerol-3-phosphate acyltransferase
MSTVRTTAPNAETTKLKATDLPEDAQDPAAPESVAAAGARDPKFLERVMPLLKLAVKGWFRSDVQGIEKVPATGGALLVSNHSGGLLAMDVPIIAVAFAEKFGLERPLYTLAHDMLFVGPLKYVMERGGLVPAHRKTADQVLRSGAVTIVFPGGDFDAFRPTAEANVIDFAGHTGYIRTALNAGVPLVPVVSIGGQEVQLFLTRGEGLMEHFGVGKLLRTKIAPVTFGFPFGFSLGVPPNFPLPAKIQTRVLDPIDIRAEFGDDPDIAEVDRAVRERMQTALDELAAKRRFPVLG